MNESEWVRLSKRLKPIFDKYPTVFDKTDRFSEESPFDILIREVGKLIKEGKRE